jgi:hypothetical protein
MIAVLAVCQEPQETGVFYVVDGTTLRALETQTAAQVIARGRIGAVLKGKQSGTRVGARPDLEFVIKPSAGQDVARYQLFQLLAKGNERSVAMSSTTRGLNVTEGRLLTFRAQKQGSVYRILPTENLAPGEYAFSEPTSQGAHTFGVDIPSTSQPVVAAPATDDRLRKLEQLLQQGLITKQDYDTKRAEIVPGQEQPASSEDRLNRLQMLLRQNLITKDDYEKKRAEILAEI